MRFNVRFKQSQWELILQADDLSVLCHLRSFQDTIHSWLCGLWKSASDPVGQERLRQLNEQIDQLAVVRLDARNRQTFFRFLHALLAFLHSEPGRPLPDQSSASTFLANYLDDLFQVHAEREGERLRYGVGGLFDLEQEIPTGTVDSISVRLWRRALRRYCDRVSLKILLGKFVKLNQATIRVQNEFEGLSYLYFCQALIEALEDNEELSLPSSQVLEICQAIITNPYGSVDEKKFYLEYLLTNCDRRETQERLFQMVDCLRANEQAGWETGEPLEILVGLMADHYLRLYDLDQVIGLWERTGRVCPTDGKSPEEQSAPRHADGLLSFLLRFYARPWIALLLIAGLFLEMVSLASLNQFGFVQENNLGSVLAVIGLIPLSTISLSLVGTAAYITARLLITRDFYYLQLLFPRLWGAIAVGLAALLLNDLPWKIGLSSHPLNLFLIGAASYLLSFLYVFLDIYQATKSLPPMAGRAAIHQTVGIAWRVFGIAFLEALLAVVFATALFFPITALRADPAGWPALALVCLQETGCPVAGLIEYGFFPVLILFWTGLALFIGTFFQLLWQDRHITESR